MVVVEIQMSLSTAGIFTKIWGDVFATEAVCGERFQGKFGSLEITHSTQGCVSLHLTQIPTPQRWTQTSTLDLYVCV